ncbi:hypothetical protein D3C81_1335910 [compost metagenome]
MTPPDTRLPGPFQDMIVGQLQRGTSDRSSGEFNSLTSWQYSGNEIELRIPWMLLGFADPSSLQVIDYGPLKKNRTFTPATTKGITFVPWIVNVDGQEAAWPGGGATVDLENQPTYTWAPWETVKYSEHLKESYYALKNLFESLPDSSSE